MSYIALEERLQDYKTKWRNRILRMGSSRLTQKLRITNQTDEEMLDDQEDNGKIVPETKQANKSLP
jgi:hypothetical protein